MSEIVSPAIDESKFSDDQRAELLQIRSEFEANRARALEAEAALQKLKEESVGLHSEQAWRKTVEGTGIAFHPSRSELLSLLRGEEGVKVWFDETGDQVLASKDGKPIDPQELVVQYAMQHEWMTDQRTLRKHRTPNPVRSREELKDNGDKIDYIKKFGLRAYENLPRRTLPDAQTLTSADYNAMTLAEKVDIVRQVGDDGVSTILRRK